MKNTNKPLTLFLGLVLVAIILTVAFFFWRGRQRMARAQHDVGVITIALDGYHFEHGQFPKGKCAEVCALLRGEPVAGQNRQRLDYVEALPREMNEEGEFIDPWGSSYRILLRAKPFVYSCGPNLQDERGDGDDIRADL